MSILLTVLVVLLALTGAALTVVYTVLLTLRKRFCFKRYPNPFDTWMLRLGGLVIRRTPMTISVTWSGPSYDYRLWIGNSDNPQGNIALLRECERGDTWYCYEWHVYHFVLKRTESMLDSDYDYDPDVEDTCYDFSGEDMVEIDLERFTMGYAKHVFEYYRGDLEPDIEASPAITSLPSWYTERRLACALSQLHAQ